MIVIKWYSCLLLLFRFPFGDSIIPLLPSLFSSHLMISLLRCARSVIHLWSSPLSTLTPSPKPKQGFHDHDLLARALDRHWNTAQTDPDMMAERLFSSPFAISVSTQQPMMCRQLGGK
ncbi:hypothetical protein V8F20_012272 [Naviculisporaceae sp. PSN 640]